MVLGTEDGRGLLRRTWVIPEGRVVLLPLASVGAMHPESVVGD